MLRQRFRCKPISCRVPWRWRKGCTLYWSMICLPYPFWIVIVVWSQNQSSLSINRIYSVDESVPAIFKGLTRAYCVSTVIRVKGADLLTGHNCTSACVISVLASVYRTQTKTAIIAMIMNKLCIFIVLISSSFSHLRGSVEYCEGLINIFSSSPKVRSHSSTPSKWVSWTKCSYVCPSTLLESKRKDQF